MLNALLRRRHGFPLASLWKPTHNSRSVWWFAVSQRRHSPGVLKKRGAMDRRIIFTNPRPGIAV
jgi:hypothetical protein